MKKTLLCLVLCLALVLPALAAGAESLLPYTGDPIVFQGYTADLGITENRESPVYKAYKEKIGNIEINWSTGPWSDFDEKIKIFLNTGDLPDIVWLRDSFGVMRDYGNMGLFLDLNKYQDQMPNLTQYRKDYPQLKYLEADDGSYYALTDIEPTDTLQESWFVNKTKLEELGLNVPETYDELVAAMQAMKDKYPDSTPFITYGWGFGYYQFALSWLNDAKYSGMFFDGEKWDHSLQSEKSKQKELVSIMAEWYEKGFLHPEFTTISDEQASQVVLDGNWLFSTYYLGAIEREIFQFNEMPYEVAPILAPAMKAGDPHYISITTQFDTIPYWGYFAGADVKHPELMAALMDFIVSEEASTLFNWGIQGLTYEVDENGNKYYLEDFATNSDRRKEVGLGNFMDVRYIMLKARDTDYASAIPPVKQAMDFVNHAAASGEAALRFINRGTPTMSQEQKELVARSLNPMNTYADEQLMLFIDGTRPLSEWDDFVAEWQKYGNIEEVIKIYEEGKQVIYAEERRIVEYGK